MEAPCRHCSFYREAGFKRCASCSRRFVMFHSSSSSPDIEEWKSKGGTEYKAAPANGRRKEDFLPRDSSKSSRSTRNKRKDPLGIFKNLPKSLFGHLGNLKTVRKAFDETRNTISRFQRVDSIIKHAQEKLTDLDIDWRITMLGSSMVWITHSCEQTQNARRGSKNPHPLHSNPKRPKTAYSLGSGRIQ